MTYNCKVYRLVTKKIQESKKENWENKNKNRFGYHKKNKRKKKMVNIKKKIKKR